MRLHSRLAAVALMALPIPAVAAVPQVVNYQGRLTDNSPQQNPLDATVTMDFSIWDAAIGGNSLWSETQSVPVVKGLFSVLLGSTTPLPPSLFTSGDTRYLEIHVSGETLTPRQQIATVPFANAAARADDAIALGGVGAAAYQQRIATPCPAGYAMNAVAADGTATCIQGAPGPPGPPGAGLNTGSISGTVTYCGAPYPGVLVYLPGRSSTAYSASDGTYQLDYLPAGTYTVQIKLPSDPGSKNVPGLVVSSGQTTAAGSTSAANLLVDAANCGACGAACSSNHITPLCSNGTCNGQCQSGFGNCNNNALSDGCETDLMNSVTSCGSCGAACSSNHMTPACYSGICSGTCDAGYTNCDSNFRSNGCETDIFNGPSNCGWCNTVCSSNHVPAPSCASGICNGVCAAGFGDCNANKQTDGCETDLSSSNANCGSCGHVCGAGTTCVSGSCI